MRNTILGLLASIVFLYSSNSLGQNEESKTEDSDVAADNEPENIENPRRPLKPTAWMSQISIKGTPIEGLELPRSQLPVLMHFQKNRFRPLVEIPITYNRPGWKLLVNGKYPLSPTVKVGRFKLFALVNSPFSEAQLVAVGPDSKSEKMTLEIMTPDAQNFEVVAPWDALKFSLGGSYFHYAQTGFNDFYAWLGTFSLSYQTPEIPSSIGFIAATTLNAISFNSNQSDYGPQLGQINLDATYHLARPTSSRYIYMGILGLNYLNIFTNGAPFGFKNLISPEAGLKVRYIATEQTDWIGEVRLASLSNSIDLNYLGIVASISKGWILKNLHRGELGFKILNVKYRPAAATEVHLQTLSYSFSYSF